jgi:hypothetical protein
MELSSKLLGWCYHVVVEQEGLGVKFGGALGWKAGGVQRNDGIVELSTDQSGGGQDIVREILAC